MYRVLALLVLAGILPACTSLQESSATSNDELAVDQTLLPTTLATLSAGDPYSPVLDERPLQIDGAKPCLEAPRVEITPGATNVEASIVASRRDLMNRLDLGVEGLPINVLKLTGATGTARLAVETSLNEASMTLLFQARGTFESSLVGLGAEPPSFDASRIGSCGWGYVKKAYHRLSAVVMVSIESADRTNKVLLGCGKDESGCTGTSLSAGAVTAKASIERTLQQGNFNISIRTLSDAIPDLPAAPLGDMIALSSSPETAADVMAKLGEALNWLGDAESAIAKRIIAIEEDPAKERAPTSKVEFAYYPGISAGDKDRLGLAYDQVIALRNDYETTLARASAWDAFRVARSEGRGHVFNVPGSPVKTEDELATRAEEAIGENGFLTTRRREIESAFARCEDAGKGGSVDDVSASCARLGDASWAAEYDGKYKIARLTPVSMKVRSYDEWRDNMCPSGQRIPEKSEADLVSPFSFAAGKDGRGIWLKRGSVANSPVFIKNGKVDTVGLFRSPEHLTLCFAKNGSLFE